MQVDIGIPVMPDDEMKKSGTKFPIKTIEPFK